MASQHLQAANLGQLQVEQDDLGRAVSGALGVGPAGKEKIQRFFAVPDDVNLVGQLMLRSAMSVSSTSFGSSSTSRSSTSLLFI